MKKIPYRFTTIIVREWFTKNKGKVYLHWELPNGQIWKRLTPYKDIPWVKFDFLKIEKDKYD